MGYSDAGIKASTEKTQFKQALTDINRSFKVLGSKWRWSPLNSQNDSSIEAVTARNKVLSKEIDEQKNKLLTLKDALDNAAASFGETDKRTQNWQIQLNKAQAELNGMERELRQNNASLDDASKEFDNVGEKADDFGDEVEHAGKQSDDAGGRFDGLASAKAPPLLWRQRLPLFPPPQLPPESPRQYVSRVRHADDVLTTATQTGIADKKAGIYVRRGTCGRFNRNAYKVYGKQIKSMRLYRTAKLSVEAFKAGRSGNKRRRAARFGYRLLGDYRRPRQDENETERDAIAMQILGKSARS